MTKDYARLKYKIVKILHSHQAFIVLIGVLVLLVFVIMRINTFNNIGYDEAYYTRETASLKSVQFNQEAIEQIEALRDSNVDEPAVQLPGDRSNPFAE